MWLGTAPDRAENDKSKAPIKTRAQQMKDFAGDDDFEPQMPPKSAAQYLLDHFWAVGPTAGDAPITWGDLEHYQRNSGIELSPWECKTLRQLSIAYINESHQAGKPNSEPPFAESTDAERLRALELARKVDTFLSD